MSDTATEWHSLTHKQWLECWGHALWKQSLTKALEEIVECDDAGLEERLGALACLNEGLQLDMLDKRMLTWPFPVLARNVLLRVARATVRPRWWRRWRMKRIQKQCTEQLAACRYMLRMAAEFAKLEPAPVASTALGFVPAKEILFS